MGFGGSMQALVNLNEPCCDDRKAVKILDPAAGPQ
jgi:hypothetical protein